MKIQYFIISLEKIHFSYTSDCLMALAGEDEDFLQRNEIECNRKGKKNVLQNYDFSSIWL